MFFLKNVVFALLILGLPFSFSGGSGTKNAKTQGYSYSFYVGKSNIPFAELPFVSRSRKEQKLPQDVSNLKNDNWYSDAMKNIIDMEYEIHYDKASSSYACPNRKNGLRSFITEDKLTIVPRNDSADKWKLDLDVQGIYAGNKQVYGPSAKAIAIENGKKVEFNNGAFTTEYINNQEGVRQNFIINQEPAGKPASLTVKLNANTGWFINKVADKEIHFAKATQTGYAKKITYNSLKAWDANNKELESDFEVKGNEICINVQTAGAAYPVTIDPLSSGATSTADATPNNANQAGAAFGTSVASAGDVNGDGFSDVVIGAPLYDAGGASNAGRVFIYHGSTTGLSSTPYSPLPDTNQLGAQFGYSVATAGDVNGDGYSDVVVGAPYYDVAGTSVDEGRAYAYYGSASGLALTPAKVYNFTNQAGANFGFSVSSAGDIHGDGYSDILIGAPMWNNGAATDAGVMYVVYGSASGLSAGSSGGSFLGTTASYHFGYCVAGAGDVNGDGYGDVLLGTPGRDNSSYTEVGGAYLGFGSSTGSISSYTLLTGGLVINLKFGTSVSAAGDVNADGYDDVVVGGPGYSGVLNTQGAIYVFYGASNSATYTSISSPHTAVGAQAGAHLGTAVACAGDINSDGFADVIAGAPDYDNGANTGDGQAYIYLGKASTLSSTPAYTLQGPGQAGAQFGCAVASAGDVNGDGYSDVIVGCEGYNDGANTGEGRAYLYHGGSLGVSESINTTMADADKPAAFFGFSVASAGDVNGDGYDDVIIGAPYFDGTSVVAEGRAFVYHGSSSGLSSPPDKILNDVTQANAHFGYSVACAGDVNGDGYADVIVGAPDYNYSTSTDEGIAMIYYGSALGLPASYNSLCHGSGQAAAHFGTSVAPAGDVNGDGYGDVIIGAPDYDDGANTDEGRAFIYNGSSTGVGASPASTPDDANQAGARFGYSVAGAGDVNGDGYADVIVGAYKYTDGANASEGRAYVYKGSATGLGASPISTPDDANQAGAQFGISVACAGDVNGDGYADVIIGANKYDDGANTDEGRAFIYQGSSSGLGASPAVTLTDANQAGAQFGVSVASAGDANGDGYSDVVVGANLYDDGYANEGRAFVYYGSSSGLAATAGSTLNDADQANIQFAYSVACAGDVNGDGYSDVIAGAYNMDDGGNVSEGKAFLYYGNQRDGARGNVRLYNTNMTTPIQQNNNAQSSFGLGFYTRSVMGHKKGRLVWEVKTMSQPFTSGSNLSNSQSFTSKQASFANLPQGGGEIKITVNKPGRSSKVRARMEFDKATAITGQFYGPWRYVAGYSQGAVGMGSTPLPVGMLSFTAQAVHGKQAKLDWIMGNEDGIGQYVIERSDDGTDFKAVGKVAAKNNVAANEAYTFTDPNAFTGEVYYRLKIEEQAGDFSYSRVATLSDDHDFAVSVFPNPVKQGKGIMVMVPSTSVPFAITIHNMAGKMVARRDVSAAEGPQKIVLSTTGLDAGYYFVTVQINNEQQVYKIIVN
jgi:hypothetical protein